MSDRTREIDDGDDSSAGAGDSPASAGDSSAGADDEPAVRIGNESKTRATDASPELRELETAHAELERTVAAVEEIGEERLDTLSDAITDCRRLLDRYDDRATGTGDFAGFVEFRANLDGLVEGLSEKLPRRDTFESIAEIFEKKRLNEGDFERAREELERAAEPLSRLERRRAARERYRTARREARERLEELDAEIEELERLRGLSELDFEVPIERFREPIEAYDSAVREAFERFIQEESARTVLVLLSTTRHYPLVRFEAPPASLREFIDSHPEGEESIPTLRSYAEYTRSKRDHYVENVRAFERAVVTERTYLERLDADPLAIGWPPPPATELRWKIRELSSIVSRIADEEPIVRLRRVRELTRDARYEDCRRIAEARNELSADRFRQLRDGSIETELRAVRDRRDRLAEALGTLTEP